MSFLIHLQCSYCDHIMDADQILNLCPHCAKPLLAIYDLKQAKEKFPRKSLKDREQNLWRYHEILPVHDPQYRLSLGEGFTPLIHARRLASHFDIEQLYIKEEGVNPTTSFKARGLSVAISKAYELGVTSVSIPSAGNAAGALSAYAACAGIEAFVYMPRDVPEAFIAECTALGATIKLIDGLITECGKIAREEGKKHNRFDVSTLKEPYRIEGKKTMGYEIAEQMDWELPDVLIYPTGGGTGLIGMWKAFDEMEKLGWINSFRPRMVCVQSTGCAPMVRAFETGTEFAESWQDATTLADGLRVPAAVGDFLILRALRESNGAAIAVSDEEMMEEATRIGHSEGIFAAPEGGATAAALKHLLQQGWINKHESVVLFNTGSGHKYSHLWINRKY